MLSLPVQAILAATFAMSQGARNWPFFTLIGLPVSPAASSRSVWRHRKAGICRTSTACAAMAHCSAVCTSVSVGQPVRFAHLGEDRQALADADAARGGDARCGWPCRSSTCRSGGTPVAADISRSAAATSRACPRDSIWHGPAINANGRSLPIATLPTCTMRTHCTTTSIRHNASVAPPCIFAKLAWPRPFC